LSDVASKERGKTFYTELSTLKIKYFEPILYEDLLLLGVKVFLHRKGKLSWRNIKECIYNFSSNGIRPTQYRMHA
jgi:hypothetical protein